MKQPVYERAELIITEFDTEDVITTSGVTPTEPTRLLTENSFGGHGNFELEVPGSWF
ncbi:MAG: hypothetical protein IJH07_07960 [Ruminococcus sp.]|nr:hypothetical protein [Ruminococcus sp.]